MYMFTSKTLTKCFIATSDHLYEITSQVSRFAKINKEVTKLE